MSRMMSKSRSLALSSLFAALTAVGAWISVPFSPVPLTLQTFFLYLSVLILRRNAFLSQMIYVLMGMVGLPVFARGMSGYGAILGPTGGFIVGFLAGAFIAGTIAEKTRGRALSGVVSLLICATIVFGFGWVWLAYWLGWNLTMALWLGVIPFLPGDCIKAGLALVLSRRIEKFLTSSQT
ncbi:MAG: biotin transporter BioY [Candidatus Methanomethylicaceae archaeon]